MLLGAEKENVAEGGLYENIKIHNENFCAKIFNVKFATFCAAFLILSWTYDQPYLQFVKEKNYPISWCIFPFYMSSFGILSIFM